VPQVPFTIVQRIQQDINLLYKTLVLVTTDGKRRGTSNQLPNVQRNARTIMENRKHHRFDPTPNQDRDRTKPFHN